MKKLPGYLTALVHATFAMGIEARHEAERAARDAVAHNFEGRVFLCESVIPNDLRAPPLGAHLVTFRRGYTHHGIYVGSGKVVHYAGLCRSWHSGPVEEVRQSRFSGGRVVGIVEHPEPIYSPQEIVERARSRLGENNYHVLKNNCEHFCNWCISGRSLSPQVERPLTYTLAALAVLAIHAQRAPQAFGSLRARVTRGRDLSLGFAGHSRLWPRFHLPSRRLRWSQFDREG